MPALLNVFSRVLGSQGLQDGMWVLYFCGNVPNYILIIFFTMCCRSTKPDSSNGGQHEPTVPCRLSENTLRCSRGTTPQAANLPTAQWSFLDICSVRCYVATLFFETLQSYFVLVLRNLAYFDIILRNCLLHVQYRLQGFNE